MKKLKNCQGVSLIILIIIVVIILCAILIFKNMNNSNNSNSSGNSSTSVNSSKLNTVVTADNYNTIGNMFNENQDELYYLSYACLYYSFTLGQDEATAMQNIYGKTVQQLIDEGKQLMKDNNITVEQYKKQLKDAN